MPNITGGQAVVQTLLANKIDTVFGIPGGHSFPVYAALAETPDIHHILGRHEQGLGFMADGFFRASGRIAAVSITSGPAIANITNALGQATTDTSAILVIASAPRADLIGRNCGGLHDINDSLDLARPVSRYAEHCSTVEEISPKLSNLIRQLREERPGGAFLQIPTDVMADRADIDVADCPQPSRRAAPEQDIEAACRLLATAERPLIIAGTGAVISEAGGIIRVLAERIGAVVSTTVLARGIIPGDLPYVIFPDGAIPTEIDEAFEAADVVLAVGTNFKQEDTANWSIRLNGKLIHIDIDAEEFGRNYSPDIAIHADAETACNAIADVLEREHPADSSWIETTQVLQAARMQRRHGDQTLDMKFSEAFRRILPRDAMLFADRCNIGYWAYRCMPCYEPRTFHYPMGYGSIGGSLPQAIGARMACPDRRVVCLIGDGGIQLTLTELAVAVQEGVRIPIVVSNNHCYGAIRANMARNLDGLDFGTELSGPDYEDIASAYGIPFLRTDDRTEFLELFATELKKDRLCLFEFDNDIGDP